MTDHTARSGSLQLDQLAGTSAPAQVLSLDGANGFDPAAAPRAPHRHDYHELFLVLDGVTEHHIDGEHVEAGAGTALMIGRGQVHVLVRAVSVRGVVIRFADELLDDAAREASPGWLLVSCGSRVLVPPPRELEHAVAIARLLEDELRRPPDAGTDRLLDALLTALLVLVQRWQAGASAERERVAGSPDVELMRRFVRLLEAEHVRHHDAGWYASRLAVSPGHLAAVLARLTGRSTKRLITDRVMTEAARLLRFTDITVQQVAQRVGYDDPLHFSRAFKVHAGVAPSVWRAQRVGSSMDPARFAMSPNLGD